MGEEGYRVHTMLAVLQPHVQPMQPPPPAPPPVLLQQADALHAPEQHP